MNKAAAWLNDKLDYEFNDVGLLWQALTHRSATGRNNERLEFLGDAVLQIVISEYVFRDRPDASEGYLSRMRSSLVKDQTLGEIGAELGFGEHLVLGSGEKKTGGHRRASILADAVEAVFGAVYLDAGMESARQFIIRVYGERLTQLPDEAGLRDPKSRLQEYLQGRQRALPVYTMENVSGKAHKQFFEVSCSVSEPEMTTQGSGRTRRDAEQEAAAAMLALLENGNV